MIFVDFFNLFETYRLYVFFRDVSKVLFNRVSYFKNKLENLPFFLFIFNAIDKIWYQIVDKFQDCIDNIAEFLIQKHAVLEDEQKFLMPFNFTDLAKPKENAENDNLCDLRISIFQMEFAQSIRKTLVFKRCVEIW